MLIIIFILIHKISSSLGNVEYITILNINPVSNSEHVFQCHTPTTFSSPVLSYGRSYKIDESDDLSESFSWDKIPRLRHRYVTQTKWNMGVYYSKVQINGKITTVQTTKFRSDAEIKPSGSTSVTVNVGDDVTISFDGNTELGVIWRKDNVQLNNGPTTQKSMTFNPVNTADVGMYEVYREGKRSERKHSFLKLIVRACPRHKWGPPECTRDCEYCLNGGICDDVTGICICAPGFMGTVCEMRCYWNSGFGSDCGSRCAEDENACMNYHLCLPDPYGCSCTRGFKGLACNVVCESGKYGADCAQSCHCKQGECNRFTGECNDAVDQSCAHPWKGTNCQECQDGFYGENCELLCSKPCGCHRITGNCIEESCYPNWLKPKCEIGIIDTTFTSVNDGQNADVDCKIYDGRGTDVVQPLIMVIDDGVTKNISASSSTSDENIITYAFSVEANVGLKYRCVILQDGISAHSDIEPVIFLLPLYNGTLKLVSISSSSVDIEWTAWNNEIDDGEGPITGYYLYYKMSNAENWEDKQYQESLSGTVTRLMWDTSYTFAVSAVRPGEGGEGPVGKQQLTVTILRKKSGPNLLGIISGIIGAAVAIFITAIIIVKTRKSKRRNKGYTESNVTFKSQGLPPPSKPDDGNNVVVKEERNLFNDSTSPKTFAYRKSIFSRRIPVSDLVSNINKMGLQQEFNLLPVDQTRPWTAAAKKCHRTKNRFKNIIPYDHARVVLDAVNGNPDSDYYNASYINGYNKKKFYLACQGPNVASLKDFWRLIWQLDIEVIVMLTNLYEGDRKKCEKYWPDKQELFDFDGINVSVTSEETNKDYIVRTIGIWREGDMLRTIKQFHFSVWPAKGVPTSASGLLRLIKVVRTARGSSEKPLLVHCSSGVGRTGTYIVIDAMLDMIKEEGFVDIPKYVKDIRGDRVNMVQTVDQYLFIYSALTESYLNDVVQFPLSQFTNRVTSLKRTNPKTKKTFMEEEFEILVAASPFPAPEAMLSGLQEHNIKKNRFANVLPVDRSRVILKLENRNYINASFLNGYKMSNRFIATQMPLVNTVEDFLQLVYYWKTTTIVMLNAMDKSDPTCAKYWPDKRGNFTTGNLEIQFISEESRGNNIIIRNITIKATNQKSTAVNVTQYQVTNWPVGHDSPERLETLIELYEIVDSTKKCGKTEEHPIVVHCLNGIGRTGIYCAMTEALDRMKNDDIIDVFQCVKRLRENRPGLVENVDQYTLCYDLVGNYLQRFATYSN